MAGSANTFWTIYLIDIDSWQNDGRRQGESFKCLSRLCPMEWWVGWVVMHSCRLLAELRRILQSKRVVFNKSQFFSLKSVDWSSHYMVIVAEWGRGSASGGGGALSLIAINSWPDHMVSKCRARSIPCCCPCSGWMDGWIVGAIAWLTVHRMEDELNNNVWRVVICGTHIRPRACRGGGWVELLFY